MSNEANDFSKVVIRNAKLHFRNFSGKESEYNKAGYRNFCVELDHQLAIDMIDDGWNIKQFKPKPDQDEEPGFYIKVNVMFGNRPPKIVIKSSGEDVVVNEDTVGMLDWAEIDKVDLIFVKHNYKYGSKTGINAYLKTMYVWIVEDELEAEYEEERAGGSTETLPFD